MYILHVRCSLKNLPNSTSTIFNSNEQVRGQKAAKKFFFTLLDILLRSIDIFLRFKTRNESPFFFYYNDHVFPPLGITSVQCVLNKKLISSTYSLSLAVLCVHIRYIYCTWILLQTFTSLIIYLYIAIMSMKWFSVSCHRSQYRLTNIICTQCTQSTAIDKPVYCGQTRLQTHKHLHVCTVHALITVQFMFLCVWEDRLKHEVLWGTAAISVKQYK